MLYLLRFDLFLLDPASLLQRIANAAITMSKPEFNNISANKNYGKRYAEFKESLKVPNNIIRSMYESRRKLIDIFYPGQFDSILSAKLSRYGQC